MKNVIWLIFFFERNTIFTEKRENVKAGNQGFAGRQPTKTPKQRNHQNKLNKLIRMERAIPKF